MDFTPEHRQKMEKIFKETKEDYARQLRYAAQMVDMVESIMGLKHIMDVHVKAEKNYLPKLTICEAFEMIQLAAGERSIFSGKTQKEIGQNFKDLEKKVEEILEEVDNPGHTEDDILRMFKDDRD